MFIAALQVSGEEHELCGGQDLKEKKPTFLPLPFSLDIIISNIIISTLFFLFLLLSLLMPLKLLVNLFYLDIVYFLDLVEG